MSKVSEYPAEKLAKFFAKLSPNQSQYFPTSSHGEVIFLTEGLTSPYQKKHQCQADSIRCTLRNWAGKPTFSV